MIHMIQELFGQTLRHLSGSMSQLGQNRKCLGGRGTSVLPPRADIVRRRAQVRFVPIVLLKKSFLTDRRNFSGPPVRSPRRGTTSFHTKTTTGRRIDPTGRRSSANTEDPTFARFSEFFDFRLLQQYLPSADSCIAAI